jgi:hypothetical protein
MAEQRHGIHAENIALLACVIGTEARDVDDVNMTRLSAHKEGSVGSTEDFNYKFNE